jgi:hypothetical protein
MHPRGDIQDGAASKQTIPPFLQAPVARAELIGFSSPGHASNYTSSISALHTVLSFSFLILNRLPLMHAYIDNHRIIPTRLIPLFLPNEARFKKCSRDVLPMLKDNIVHAC